MPQRRDHGVVERGRLDAEHRIVQLVGTEARERGLRNPSFAGGATERAVNQTYGEQTLPNRFWKKLTCTTANYKRLISRERTCKTQT